MVRLSKANRRAFCTSVLFCATAIASALSFHLPTAWLLGVVVPCQNRAASVWSAVRVVLSKAPSDWTWLNAAVYSGLSSAGGGGGRNWEPLCMQKGVTRGHCGTRGGA